MAEKAEGLGARLGDAVRENLANQGKAYRDYGALLQRLSAREVKTVEFARDAVDIYIGAVGKTAASGVAMVGQIMGAGIQGAGSAGSAAATAVANAAAPAAENLTAPAKPARARPAAKPKKRAQAKG